MLHGIERTGTAQLDVAHVTHVEETDAGADCHVLVDQAAGFAIEARRIFDGHVPSAEIDHFRAQSAMHAVERSLAELSDGGRGQGQVSSRAAPTEAAERCSRTFKDNIRRRWSAIAAAMNEGLFFAPDSG